MNLEKRVEEGEVKRGGELLGVALSRSNNS